MKSIGGLLQGICTTDNLHKAFVQSLHGKRRGADALRFMADLETELSKLGRDIASGTYEPLGYRQFRIRDPKPRLISCAPFRDRVAQHAICNYIGPEFDKRFISGSFACRKGKGSHKAVLQAQKLSRKHEYFCKLDISKFFDSVDHAVLLSIIRKMFREAELLTIIEKIIKCPYSNQAPGKGLPIGNLTSQWFANLYLNGADHHIKDILGIPGYIRYMDDMLLFADIKDELWKYVTSFVEWLKEERKLSITQKVLNCHHA